MEFIESIDTSERQQFGWIQRDTNGEIIIEENGYITCISEGGIQFQIPYNEIDFNCETLQVVIDNNTIIIKVNDHMQNNNVIKNKHTGIQQSTTEEPFVWTDANTKLFLHLYKDAITHQKIRIKKILWRKLSEALQSHNYNASAAQVENKFKSLERSYKTMITNNKKTGRNRISCSYETELADLFANKHNIIPLAVSGSEGTIVREDLAGPSSSSVCHANKENIHHLSTGTSNVNSRNSNNDSINPDNSHAVETDNPLTCTAMRNNTYDYLNETLQNRGKKRQLGNTGRILEICQQEMRTLIEDIRRERNGRLEIQKQMLETYAQYMKKMHETMQERNEILKQLIRQSANEKID